MAGPPTLITCEPPSVILIDPVPAVGVSFWGLTSILNVVMAVVLLPSDTSNVKLDVKSSLPSCWKLTLLSLMSFW